MMGALEEHYTPQELGKIWNLHPDTIRSIFRNEPEVFVLNRPEKMNKRGYATMRIPASVAARVHHQHRGRGNPNYN